jgi:hypothetical protein
VLALEVAIKCLVDSGPATQYRAAAPRNSMGAIVRSSMITFEMNLTLPQPYFLFVGALRPGAELSRWVDACLEGG